MHEEIELAGSPEPDIAPAPVDSQVTTLGTVKKKRRSPTYGAERRARVAESDRTRDRHPDRTAKKAEAHEAKTHEKAEAELATELVKLRQEIDHYSRQRPTHINPNGTVSVYRSSDHELGEELIETGTELLRDVLWNKKAIPFEPEFAYGLLETDQAKPYTAFDNKGRPATDDDGNPAYREYTHSYLDAVCYRALQIQQEIQLTPMLQQFIDKICVAFEGWSEKQVAKFDWLDEIANRRLNEPEQEPRKPGPVPGSKKQERELIDMKLALEAAQRANGKGYEGPQVYSPKTETEIEPIHTTPFLVREAPASASDDIQAIIRRNQQRILQQRQHGISDNALKYLNGDDGV